MRLGVDFAARLAGADVQVGHRWSTREGFRPSSSPSAISYTTFISVLWMGFSLAAVFLLCRLFARFRGPRRLFWDDGFAIFALVLVTATAGLWQRTARDMFYTFNVEAGLDAYRPDFFDRLHRWLLASLAAELFYYTSLLSIKLALLVFFRRLGNNVNYFGRLWWTVLLITLVAYVVSISDLHYKCFVGSDSEILGEKCNTPDAMHINTTTLAVNCGLDVLTDGLIITLPIFLLRKVQIRTRKKLAFCGLFSLSLITMTIAVVRVYIVGAKKLSSGQLDPPYLYMWNALEPCVAIVVACLSAFPQLFAQSGPNHRKPAPYRPSDTYLRLMSRIRSARNEKSRVPPGHADDTLFGLETMDDNLADMPGRELASQKRPVLTSTSTSKQHPVLVPGPQPPAVAQVRSTRGDDEALRYGLRQFTTGPRDRITQRLEYCVERNSP